MQMHTDSNLADPQQARGLSARVAKDMAENEHRSLRRAQASGEIDEFRFSLISRRLPAMGVGLIEPSVCRSLLELASGDPEGSSVEPGSKIPDPG
jgi:hypothetical protein